MVRLLFILTAMAFALTAQAFSAQRTILDLPYTADPAADANQKLNLVIPEGEGSHPLFIWIGGGAWSYVDRNMEMDLAEKLSRYGIAVASVGHRLSSAVWQDPELTEGVQHPAHISDIAAAVAWLIDNASNYDLNADHIVIGGFSSGAHLAALLAADPQYLEAHGLTLERLSGVVAIGGTYDIRDYHRAFREGSRPALATEHVEAVFGSTEEAMQSASPALFAETFETSMLLISDANTYNYTRIFEDALVDAEHTELAVVHVRHLGHGPLWQHLSHAEQSSYREQMASFITDGLPAPQPAP
ncbi:MAG: alpha/beta hydrolase fold domain-containing protein [Pseudomonadota bacterium]